MVMVVDGEDDDRWIMFITNVAPWLSSLCVFFSFFSFLCCVSQVLSLALMALLATVVRVGVK